MYEYYVEELEHHYYVIEVHEKGHEGLMGRKRKTEAVYNDTRVSIKEYIEIRYENVLNNRFGEVTYEYTGWPYSPEHIYNQYSMTKYNNKDTELSCKDYEKIDALFHELMPIIIELKIALL